VSKHGAADAAAPFSNNGLRGRAFSLGKNGVSVTSALRATMIGRRQANYRTINQIVRIR
jgi:hypothetical protein